MGLFDDLFPSSSPEPSGGLFDSLFGGGPSKPDTSSSFFGTYAPHSPSFGTHSGYGDQPYLSRSDADKSRLMSGIVKDDATDYTGEAQDIYDRYIAEGRDPSGLFKQFGK